MEVPTGKITVLLGANGAGKTTALRLATGALNAESGEVRTFGLDPSAPNDGDSVRLRLGVVSAKPSLYERLSGWDNLVYSARMYGVRDESAIREAAERFRISDALQQRVGGYSTGMKARLALARSIIHDPELLLYDEPTSGLDPESSQRVLDLIRQMTDQGRTVVMCTHLLAEAEGLADHVVVMGDGSNFASGDLSTLASRYLPERVVFIEVEQGEESDLRQLDDAIAPMSVVQRYDRSGRNVTVHLDDFASTGSVVKRITATELSIRRVDPQEPTLERVYFAAQSSAQSAPTASPTTAAR